MQKSVKSKQAGESAQGGGREKGGGKRDKGGREGGRDGGRERVGRKGREGKREKGGKEGYWYFHPRRLSMSHVPFPLSGYQYGRIPWADADITVLVDERGVPKFCLQELCIKVCVYSAHNFIDKCNSFLGCGALLTMSLVDIFTLTSTSSFHASSLHPPSSISPCLALLPIPLHASPSPLHLYPLPLSPHPSTLHISPSIQVLTDHVKSEVFEVVKDLNLPMESGDITLLKKLQALGLHSNR